MTIHSSNSDIPEKTWERIFSKRKSQNSKTKTINAPGRCPACGSTNIEYHGGNIEQDMYCFGFTCLDCGAEALEWYKLVFDITMEIK